MATVGEQLLTPELGWKRVESSPIHFQVLFGTTLTSDVSYSGGTEYTYDFGDRIPNREAIKFKFFGTSLRIIGYHDANRSDNNRVVIDGVNHTFSQRTGQGYQRLSFHIDGLPEQIHDVSIYTGNGSYSALDFDAVDINEDGIVTMSPGYELLVPDPGWIRYNDTDPNILTTPPENWTIYENQTGMTGGTTRETPNITGVNINQITFKFVGTAFRLLMYNWSNRCPSVEVNIDGTVVGSYTEYVPSGQVGWQSPHMMYEHIGLDYKEHTVILTQRATGYFTLDAIDIPRTGWLGPSLSTFLVDDDGTIKSYTEGVWKTLGEAPATDEMFDNDGMPVLDLTREAIELLLSEQPKFLYRKTSEESNVVIRTTQIPYPQLILPNGDINIDDIENIDNISLGYVVTGSAIFRLIVSVDGGVSWNTYSDDQWITIDTELENVKMNGIEPQVMEAITGSQWSTLVNGKKKLRIGYYMEITQSSDEVSTDTLTLQVDLRGTWRKAIHGTDFDYEYPNNTTLTVYFFKNGDYKINY